MGSQLANEEPVQLPPNTTLAAACVVLARGRFARRSVSGAVITLPCEQVLLAAILKLLLAGLVGRAAAGEAHGGHPLQDRLL